jgi:predicted ATPase
MFRDALNDASQRGALSWQLRAATSLARLYLERGDAQTARQTLEPTYHHFTEGFASADLVAAKTMPDQLI